MLKYVIAFCVALTMPGQVIAQADFPNRPIRIVVPYAAGGGSDVAARIMADGLSVEMKQPVVIENKPGAGAMLGGDLVARSRPDGYTLFIGTNASMLISPLVFPNPLYTWDKAFAPVSLISVAPTLMIVRPSLPVKTLKEFVDLARNSNPPLTFSTGGAGSINHILSEVLMDSAKIKLRLVHYRGNAPGVVDLLAGNVDSAIVQIPDVIAYLPQGTVRAIAATGAERIAEIPMVETARESGYAELLADSYTGIVAPKATPPEIINRLSTAIQAVMRQPEIMKKYETLGVKPRGTPPETYAAILRERGEVLEAAVKRTGIKAAE